MEKEQQKIPELLPRHRMHQTRPSKREAKSHREKVDVIVLRKGELMMRETSGASAGGSRGGWRGRQKVSAGERTSES